MGTELFPLPYVKKNTSEMTQLLFFFFDPAIIDP